MKRALALVERDMRKFRRSPALLFSSLVLPLVQLIILGNAFGGNIKNVILGVVNLDRGPESVDVLERVRAVGANARTFLPTDYDDEGAALNDLRKGVLGGVLIIPQHYSRDLLEQHQPHLALITDNTDRSVAGAVGDQMSTWWPPSTRPRSRRANRSRPCSTWSRSIPISTTSSICCPVRWRWPSSSPP